jgi:hypothetical protein
LDAFIGFNGEEVNGGEGKQGLEHGVKDDEGFQPAGRPPDRPKKRKAQSIFNY